MNGSPLILLLSLSACVAGSEGLRGPFEPGEPEPGLRADLSAGPIVAPQEIRLDSILQMRIGVRNTGTRSAGTGWVIRVFLSLDPLIDPADIQIDQFVVTRELAAGAEDQYLRNRKLYRGTATGSYFIGSILDVTEVVSEITETNNTLRNPTTITLNPILPPLPGGD
jgi:hypothetical protein